MTEIKQPDVVQTGDKSFEVRKPMNRKDRRALSKKLRIKKIK
jgi:hypothetical protein